MEELLKDVGFKSKVKSLSPIVRKALIEALLDLYEQETEDMIDVIEESRHEIRNSVMAYKHETEQLRSQSRQLRERRHSNEQSEIDGQIKKKGSKDTKGNNPKTSQVSYVNECSGTEKDAVREYMRKRDRYRLKGQQDATARSSTSLSEPASASLRPLSVHSTRSLPTPVITKSLEEQTDDIMKDLTHADRKAQRERQRQSEMLEKRKEKKRQDQRSREEKAMELLEKALLMDKQLALNKERQDKKVQERINEMKQRKEKERDSPDFESVKVDPFLEIEKF